MKTTNILLGLLVLIGGASLFPAQAPTFLGGGFDSYSGTTVATSTVTTAVTRVLNADANRRMLLLQNHSSSSIYCLLEGDTATSSSKIATSTNAPVGFLIQASSTAGRGGTFIEKGYTGVVNCAATAAASTTIITSP